MSAIEQCGFCDDTGTAVSPVTGARGKCRHPYVAYPGERNGRNR